MEPSKAKTLIKMAINPVTQEKGLREIKKRVISAPDTCLEVFRNLGIVCKLFHLLPLENSESINYIISVLTAYSDDIYIPHMLVKEKKLVHILNLLKNENIDANTSRRICKLLRHVSIKNDVMELMHENNLFEILLRLLEKTSDSQCQEAILMLIRSSIKKKVHFLKLMQLNGIIKLMEFCLKNTDHLHVILQLLLEFTQGEHHLMVYTQICESSNSFKELTNLLQNDELSWLHNSIIELFFAVIQMAKITNQAKPNISTSQQYLNIFEKIIFSRLIQSLVHLMQRRNHYINLESKSYQILSSLCRFYFHFGYLLRGTTQTIPSHLGHIWDEVCNCGGIDTLCSFLKSNKEDKKVVHSVISVVYEVNCLQEIYLKKKVISNFSHNGIDMKFIGDLINDHLYLLKNINTKRKTCGHIDKTGEKVNEIEHQEQQILIKAFSFYYMMFQFFPSSQSKKIIISQMLKYIKLSSYAAKSILEYFSKFLKKYQLLEVIKSDLVAGLIEFHSSSMINYCDDCSKLELFFSETVKQLCYLSKSEFCDSFKSAVYSQDTEMCCSRMLQIAPYISSIEDLYILQSRIYFVEYFLFNLIRSRSSKETFLSLTAFKKMASLIKINYSCALSWNHVVLWKDTISSFINNELCDKFHWNDCDGEVRCPLRNMQYDISFKINNCYIPANKSIITKNEVFKAWLSHRYINNNEKEVIEVNSTYNSFSILINVVHGCRCLDAYKFFDLSKEDLYELFFLGDMYFEPKLQAYSLVNLRDLNDYKFYYLLSHFASTYPCYISARLLLNTVLTCTNYLCYEVIKDLLKNHLHLVAMLLNEYLGIESDKDKEKALSIYMKEYSYFKQ